MSTCNKCGKGIIWIKTKKGKNMPLDEKRVNPKDVEKGMFIGNKDGEVWQLKEDGKLPNDDGRAWFISHFSTCTERGN